MPFDPAGGKPLRVRQRDGEVTQLGAAVAVGRRSRGQRQARRSLKRAQDSVDESRGARLANRAHELDRLVDRRVRWNPIEMRELIGCQPQDGANARRQLAERPAAGPSEPRIERRAPAQRPRGQLDEQRTVAFVPHESAYAFDLGGQGCTPVVDGEEHPQGSQARGHRRGDAH